MATKQKTMSRDDIRELLLDQNYAGNELERVLDAVDDINRIKAEKNAIVLAHYYMRDVIKFGIADYVGDSLDLSRAGRDTDADLIVFCGVNFMAETAKILSPGKTVLLPTLAAGCSLAESITAEDVRKLRSEFPNAAVVTYVNTTADVKAESDVCVTSANAKKIVAALPNDEIIFLPDMYMGANIAAEMPEKKFITWKGTCIVHERFTGPDLMHYKAMHPGLKVLAHYECPPDVLEMADMHGGTSDMRRYIAENPAQSYLLATECGMSSTIKEEFPEKEILGPCNLCPYMKSVDIYNTRKTLIMGKPEIIVPEGIRIRALRSLERMFELT